MAIKDDLLRKGYLPENLPHAFHTESIADHFLANPTNEILSQGSQPARPANYNASKRGMTRRNFALIHPTTSHDLAEFIFRRWRRIRHFYASSELSLSQPVHTPEGDRAVEITSHTELDTQKLNRLSRYRYIAKTDISRFYHSIYTHSIPWAFHTKEAAKADRSTNSANIFFNRADLIIRLGQDGQTIGIPVGPDASRVLAEVVSTAIDGAYGRRSQDLNVGIIRHVDDVWIGAHTHADAEAALWRYREAIREFELDINENKTRIYSDDFRFSEVWPFELANLLDIAVDSSGRRAPERLRAALEHAFSLAIGTGDEAVIKYAIRYLDQSDLNWAHWETIEPFLKRAAIHFGHTFDYIARVIVWRHLARNDLDIEVWQEILLAILDRHGRLGNDSEVSWAIYTCLRLGIQIPHSICANIVHNCGALSILALLNCVESEIVSARILASARALLEGDCAVSAYWPLALEWSVREWTGYRQVQINNDVMEELVEHEVLIFDSHRLPSVFDDLNENEFSNVNAAIEDRVSFYDHENED